MDEEYDGYEHMDTEGRLTYLARKYLESDADYRSYYEGRLIEATIDINDAGDEFHKLGVPCICSECCTNA